MLETRVKPAGARSAHNGDCCRPRRAGILPRSRVNHVMSAQTRLPPGSVQLT